ncbi:hypothetical protein [Streptomyces sp. NBC_01618]|uniref:hypothetical protein n=1 Tax=Streptomyces sp. NBC_01618 TaxID=2975900 RepID=UPI00386877E5|nr:hypothetical protein OH735_37065 [Streptomyces sp. NBC_01618]
MGISLPEGGRTCEEARLEVRGVQQVADRDRHGQTIGQRKARREYENRVNILVADVQPAEETVQDRSPERHAGLHATWP